MKVPVSLTVDELTAAHRGAVHQSFSLVRDGERQYTEPREVPQPLGGRHTGSVGHPEQQRDRQMFDIKERWASRPNNDGKVYLNLLMDINCYFYNARVISGVGDVNYSAPPTTAVRIWTSALLTSPTPSLAGRP